VCANSSETQFRRVRYGNTYLALHITALGTTHHEHVANRTKPDLRVRGRQQLTQLAGVGASANLVKTCATCNIARIIGKPLSWTPKNPTLGGA